MSYTVDSEKLAQHVRNKRGDKKLVDVSVEIGEISIATISRIEKGRLPDLSTFFKICNWLEMPPDTFYYSSGSTSSRKQEILTHLRADRNLEPDAVDALVTMIEFAYNRAFSPQ